MDKKLFIATLIRLRQLQLYYHYCHNLVTGPSFIADHEMLGGFYKEVEVNYDTVAEYLVALLGNKAFDTVNVTKLVAESLESFEIEDMSPEEMFKNALKIEQQLDDALTKLSKGAGIGLQNALGAVAELADVRKYKIKQRLSK